MSTQALVVLLLFEDLKEGEIMSYSVSRCQILYCKLLTPEKDISTSTDLPESDLQRTLQSLACGKFRILTKHPKSRDVTPNDSFSFNDTFTSPLARIKIMQIASKVETPKEREETQEMVDEERRHQVEVNYLALWEGERLG